jgi:hypothetical protein
MLERSDTKAWFLWGFSCDKAIYFECHETRAGSVASSILKYSLCVILLSDVFSGYGTAIKDVNIYRKENNLELLVGANCNAHARRYFVKAAVIYSQAKFFVDQYSKIYTLEATTFDDNTHERKSKDEILEIRAKMIPLFEEMKKQAELQLDSVSEKGKLGIAIKYFINNYNGFTLFIRDHEVAIDNNRQERGFRPHAVGRKTWLGTHSEQGARTAATLFTIVESCKMNKVNPREYLPAQIENIKKKIKVQTPFEWKKSLLNKSD